MEGVPDDPLLRRSQRTDSSPAWRDSAVDRAMKVAIPREVRPGERRVAATPETSARLHEARLRGRGRDDAGAGASFADDDYEAVGATIVPDPAELWAERDIVLKVQPPELHPNLGVHEAELLREGGTIISFLWPAQEQGRSSSGSRRARRPRSRSIRFRASRARRRWTRSSSMANIAGYRAVIEAASFFGRFFTGQMTAAGKVPPAKVLVIGAGVAGLAAIGAARGLGAIVRAFDTRPAVKEQVKSMGAEFIELNVQGGRLRARAATRKR